MGKLVSPRSVPPAGQSSSIEQQQQMALAHAQAQARAHGLEKARRVSGTSVVSTTSTRADSILESFPFVPPSPIASRPVRSPPRSPLCQQASSATIQLNVQTPLPVPPSSFTISWQPGALEVHESLLPPLTPTASISQFFLPKYVEKMERRDTLLFGLCSHKKCKYNILFSLSFLCKKM
ncbi:hypothetical protein EDD17DRAFT_1558274, partial [Pisolithus thermaeus]